MAKKILICEDNQANKVLLRDLLSIDGFEIVEARDGAEGVALALASKPDLVIMDIQMPVMNGYDAMRALRADPRTSGTRIIAITSFAMAGDRELAIEAGADEYLSKPIDTRYLRRLARRLLDFPTGD